MSGEGRGGEVRGLRAEDLVKLVNFVKSEEVGSLSRLFFSLIVILDWSPLSTVTFELAGTGGASLLGLPRVVVLVEVVQDGFHLHFILLREREAQSQKININKHFHFVILYF